MIRKQVYVRPAQDKAVKKLSRKKGITEAEYIRRAIDNEVDADAGSVERTALWLKEDEFIRGLMALGSVHGGRTWTREDLYDRPGKTSK
jgi:hypothetical protein